MFRKLYTNMRWALHGRKKFRRPWALPVKLGRWDVSFGGKLGCRPGSNRRTIGD